MRSRRVAKSGPPGSSASLPHWLINSSRSRRADRASATCRCGLASFVGGVRQHQTVDPLQQIGQAQAPGAPAGGCVGQTQARARAAQRPLHAFHQACRRLLAGLQVAAELLVRLAARRDKRLQVARLLFARQAIAQLPRHARAHFGGVHAVRPRRGQTVVAEAHPGQKSSPRIEVDENALAHPPVGEVRVSRPLQHRAVHRVLDAEIGHQRGQILLHVRACRAGLGKAARAKGVLNRRIRVGARDPGLEHADDPGIELDAARRRVLGGLAEGLQHLRLSEDLRPDAPIPRRAGRKVHGALLGVEDRAPQVAR